jgi:16S rRNA (adenine1518-N6/adenine1519-N6)-dimethyltransferase
VSGARRLFAARGLRAKKSLGQCFLADDNVARRIAREATAPQGACVLEIGAGTGALTARLLERARKVVAIERDRELVALLREAFAEPIGAGSLVLVGEDALACDWPALLEGEPPPRTLAGNIPYLLTGALLKRAVAVAPLVDRVVLMVQREVAARLAARPGTKDYGALTVLVGVALKVVRVVRVPSSCFRPRPKVDSAVVVLEPLPAEERVKGETFRALVVAAFGKRRKTLRNAWAGVCALSAGELERACAEAGIDLDARGETLGLEDFARMALVIGGRAGSGR